MSLYTVHVSFNRLLRPANSPPPGWPRLQQGFLPGRTRNPPASFLPGRTRDPSVTTLPGQTLNPSGNFLPGQTRDPGMPTTTFLPGRTQNQGKVRKKIEMPPWCV